jgi:hypothetical protein
MIRQQRERGGRAPRNRGSTRFGVVATVMATSGGGGADDGTESVRITSVPDTRVTSTSDRRIALT